MEHQRKEHPHEENQHSDHGFGPRRRRGLVPDRRRSGSAAPGVSVSVDGHTVGVGDNTATGAQTSSTKGNGALAVSVLGPSRANANGSGHGNVALAADSGPGPLLGANVYGGNNNLVIASPLSGAHVVDGDRNIVASSLGVSGVSGDDNRVFSVGSNVGALTDDEASNRTVVAVCGASIVSAQGASIASNC